MRRVGILLWMSVMVSGCVDSPVVPSEYDSLGDASDLLVRDAGPLKPPTRREGASSGASPPPVPPLPVARVFDAATAVPERDAAHGGAVDGGAGSEMSGVGRDRALPSARDVAPGSSSSAPQDRGAADGGGASLARPARHGAIVFTELMVDPKAVTDAAGEWFELYNPGQETLELQGCVIADGSAQQRALKDHRAVVPGGYVTVARSDAAGFTPDLVTAFSLKNGADRIELICDGVRIDRVEYDKAQGFPVASGVAMSLDDSSLDADRNDDAAAWCLATAAYSVDADRGSPGKPNPACQGTDDGGTAG